MSPRDLLRLVLANLARMRARVALTSVGVMIGTAAVVLLISLGVGLQQSAMSSFESFGDLTTVTVLSQGAISSFSPGAAGPETVLDADAVKAIKALPHVVDASPRVRFQGPAQLKYGRSEYFTSFLGIEPGIADALGWQVSAGAFRVGRGQAVLGSKVLDQTGGPQTVGRAAATPRPLSPDEVQGRTLTAVLTKVDEKGETVTRNERLRIVGILEEQGDQSDYAVYMGLDQIQDLNTWLTGHRPTRRDGYSEVLVKVDDRDTVLGVQNAIREIGFESFSSQTILQGLNQVFILIQAVLGGVGGVALVVAAVGIANTMTMAIYERTREIGIMKALGATNRDVLQIFLAEAGAIGFLGGFLGVSLGYLAGVVIDFLVRNLVLARQGPPPEGGFPHIVVTPAWLMAFALVFSAIIGLLSGVYPALRAASMKPLRALRTE